jgi:hypothetical protein
MLYTIKHVLEIVITAGVGFIIGYVVSLYLNRE